MSDLITLVGTIVDHEGAAPLEGARITATPSQRVTQTSDGEEALSDASATTDETGAFSLALVYAEGLRYTIVYRSGGERLMRGVLDCDSYTAGATVDVADLPPIAGVPPSAVETLQAWVLAYVASLDVDPAVIEQAVLDYLAANPPGIPDHNDTTNRDAADAHPMSAITGLVAALDGKVEDDDARLSDARTPTAHAASHGTGGSDQITPASIGAAPASHTQAASTITDLTETVQDIVGGFIVAGTNVTVTYDDVANTFTINATAETPEGTDPEIVRDVIGAALAAGSGIQITVDDAGNTITIGSTAVLPTRQVIAGDGLTGGGDLSANRTLAVDFTEVATAAQGALADTALQVATAQPINAQTGTTYTLVAGDAGKLVTLDNTGAITLNAPGSVFTAGQRVDVLVLNTGMATVVGTSGATANGTPTLVSRAQYSAFTVVWLSATSAVVIGDMAAA